jgi:hypothetical protein
LIHCLEEDSIERMIKDSDQLQAWFSNRLLMLQLKGSYFFDVQQILFHKEQPPLKVIENFPPGMMINLNKKEEEFTQFQVGPVQSFRLKHFHSPSKSEIVININRNYSSSATGNPQIEKLEEGMYDMCFTTQNGDELVLRGVFNTSTVQEEVQADDESQTNKVSSEEQSQIDPEFMQEVQRMEKLIQEHENMLTTLVERQSKVDSTHNELNKQLSSLSDSLGDYVNAAPSG